MLVKTTARSIFRRELSYDRFYQNPKIDLKMPQQNSFDSWYEEDLPRMRVKKNTIQVQRWLVGDIEIVYSEAVRRTRIERSNGNVSPLPSSPKRRGRAAKPIDADLFTPFYHASLDKKYNAVVQVIYHYIL